MIAAGCRLDLLNCQPTQRDYASVDFSVPSVGSKVAYFDSLRVSSSIFAVCGTQHSSLIDNSCIISEFELASAVWNFFLLSMGFMRWVVSGSVGGFLISYRLHPICLCMLSSTISMTLL